VTAAGPGPTPVRAEPRDDAEQVTQLLPDEPAEVEETDGEWTRIRTAYDYPGWARTAALSPVPGTVPEAWLPGPSPGENPVDEARAYLGTPYEWGGMTERGIDCSGLVHMAYRRTGRLVPRDADQQEEAGAPLNEDELRPGDLITYGDESTTHIAFWLGDGRILHSTERDDVACVLEELEPADLRDRRRALVRLQ
jgi:cell wall-associated NlpC family hydrolase